MALLRNAPLLVALVCSGLPARAQSVTAKLASVEPGTGSDDLAALAEAVKGARIVALGESTHGTHEFFRLKHRLVEFLFGQGFNVFAIEAYTAESYLIDQYVRTGAGDAKQLLAGLRFWTWNTQEVLDLIEWMQAFNTSRKDQVRFLGIDMQLAGAPLQNIRDFICRSDPRYLKQFEEVAANITAVDPTVKRDSKPTMNQRELAVESAKKILARLRSRSRTYTRARGKWETEWIIHNAELVLQSCRYFISGEPSPLFRDEAMAANVDWILEHVPNARVVLWAHNQHIAETGESMGSYLAKRHGAAYVTIALSMFKGRYNAGATDGSKPWLRSHEASPAQEGTVEQFLHGAGLGSAIVAVNSLNGSLLMRTIGGVAVERLVPLKDCFDFITVLDDSTETKLLPKEK